MSDSGQITPAAKFRSDVTVELVRSAAEDSDVVWSARVSTAGEKSLEAQSEDPNASKGLINFLMKNRHGTPFEHNSMTIMISAPIFVFREFHSHRVGWSYNEESGRYRELAPVFYVPGPDRKLVQVGKAGHYEFLDGTAEQSRIVHEATIRACESSYAAYQQMLDAGVAREVARGVLPVNTFSTMYATCNARSLMSFLSLRTKDNESHFPSYPQREIEMVAEKMEAEWARLMPITHAAFTKNGRVAP
ncbi:MAG: thymidylate synthase [Actinomycetota bacterium]|nr:thymidylate synthase [Actinomycetota bacterium]